MILAPRAATTRQGQGVVLLALASGLASGVTLTAPGALETWLVADLRLSHGLAGLTQSAFFGGNLVGSLLVSWLLYRLRTRAVGLAALALLIAGNVLTASSGYLGLVAGRLLTGLGVSAAVVICSSLLVRAADERRQAALLSGLHASIAAGAVLALAGARPLGRLLATWRAPFGVCALLGLVPLALLAALPLPATVAPDGGDDAQPPRLRAVVRTFGRPAVLVTLLLMAGYVLAEQGTTTFFAAYVEAAGLPPRTSALLAGLFWLGLGAGRLLAALALRRVSPARQLIGLTLIGLALLSGSAAVPASSAWLLLCGVVIAGALLGPVIPLGFAVAVRQVDGLEGSVLGVGNAAACVGGTVGPWLVGAVADASSLQAGLLTGYAICLACAAPFSLLAWRRRIR